MSKRYIISKADLRRMSKPRVKHRPTKAQRDKSKYRRKEKHKHARRKEPS